jgi:GrpB-like predicted nucleotidyltransferase (UPF0157 family)
VAVDHIRITAVPGLAAKPAIDVDVTLSGLDEVPAASEAFIKAGFEPRGNRYDDDVWAFLFRATVEPAEIAIFDFRAALPHGLMR